MRSVKALESLLCDMILCRCKQGHPTTHVDWIRPKTELLYLTQVQLVVVTLQLRLAAFRRIELSAVASQQVVRYENRSDPQRSVQARLALVKHAARL